MSFNPDQSSEHEVYLELELLVSESPTANFCLIMNTWVLIVFGTAALLLLQRWSKARKLKLPPGPFNWPIIGAIPSMETRFHFALHRFAKEYGPIAYFRIGHFDMVVVSTVELAEEVLKHRDSVFSGRPTNHNRCAVKYLGFNGSDMGLQGYTPNLVFLKKVCVTEIFTVARLKESEQVRKNEISKTLRRIHAKAVAGEVVNVREMLLSTTTMIVSTLLFGKRFQDGTLSIIPELRDFKDVSQEFVALISAPNIVDVFPSLEFLDPQGVVRRYKKLNQRVKSIFDQVINEHKQVRVSVANHQDEDFVDIMLTHLENGKITEDNIYGTLLDMMTGGIESTVATTEWALLELCRHPSMLKKLQAEVDAVVGRERPVSDSQYASMPYLQAVISETYRLHSPQPFMVPHSNEETTTLAGYDIPAHSGVFINARTISLDPNLWKNPTVFDPERFMGENEPLNLHGNNYKLVPFGSGRRMCPGRNLGWVVLLRSLVSYVQAFDWTPPPGMSPEDISIEDAVKNAVEPAIPLTVVPTLRVPIDVYS